MHQVEGALLCSSCRTLPLSFDFGLRTKKNTMVTRKAYTAAARYGPTCHSKLFSETRSGFPPAFMTPHCGKVVTGPLWFASMTEESKYV